MPKVDDEYYRHDVERLWQDIRFGELDFLLACVCRPPSNCLFESDDFLFRTIGRVAAGKAILITCDFNLLGIGWPLLKTTAITN